MDQKILSQTAYIFGSFNPIHIGHLMNIHSISIMFNKTCVIPSPNNPHKDSNSLLPFPFRVDLIKDSISKLSLNNDVYVDTIENSMDLPNYTYKTIRELKKRDNVDKLVLVFGTDVLVNLPKWRNYGEVLNNHFIHVKRPGCDVSDIPHEVQDNIIFETTSLHNVSSTKLRESIINGDVELTRSLVPDIILPKLINWYNNK